MPALILAIALLLLSGAAPAHAQQPVPAGSQAGVLDVVLTFLVDLRASIRNCPALPDAAQSAAADDWDEARAVLVGTLWANDVPPETVARLEALFDGEGHPGDCLSDSVRYGAQLIAERGWVTPVKGALTDIGFAAVEKPANSAQWGEIKSVLMQERSQHTRLLECVAVEDPLNLPFVAANWSRMLIEAGQAMVAAGIPRHEIVAEIDASDVGRLWTFPEDRAERAHLLAECRTDSSWMEYYTTMQNLRLTSEIKRILGAGP